MSDIRKFFQADGAKPVAKPTANAVLAAKPPQKTGSKDDNSTRAASNTKKRSRVILDEDSDDDIVVTKEEKIKTKTPEKKRKHPVADTNAESDVDMEEIDVSYVPQADLEETGVKHRAPRAPVPSSSPASKAKSDVSRTSAPRPASKISKTSVEESPKKEKAANNNNNNNNTAAASTPVSGSNAEEILARIPDGVLPDVDPSKKVNFRDIIASRQANSNSTEPVEALEIPEASENCLAGLTFVFTGIMPNLGREQAQSLVKKYGGRVTTAPSRNTSCVVLGEDAGPKKIEAIKKLGIKVIDQDGFMLLLKSMPANGGGGALALKAMEKKAKEREKVEQEAIELDKQFKREQQALEQKSKEKKGLGDSTSLLANVDDQLWTDKYAPKDLAQICGNKAAIERLAKWLKNWRYNAKHNFKGSGDDSSYYRAAILHGPPGIGKTTAAHLVAEMQGFDVIESNASDVRSKTLLQTKIAGIVDNTSIEGFFYGKKDPKRQSKRNLCLIMDEVDGMSAGDRGGVGAMAALCKTTSVPIILICNERTLPKMRPFDKVTYDIPFRRPDVNSIRTRMLTIARREGLELSDSVVDQLAESTRGDIRQIVNLLSSYARTQKSLSYDQSKAVSKASEKNILLRPFDIVGRYMSSAMWSASSPMTLNDKIELYFHDHDFAPLMVQENYLNTMPSKAGSIRGGHLALVAEAASSISDGDLVDRMIHGSQQQWSLMPLHAIMSTVRPSYLISGQARGRYNFTSLLGNISKTGKYQRLLQELHSHARLKISGDLEEIRLQYMTLLEHKLLDPLLKQGAEGIDEVMQTMDDYYLTKEDWDVIMDFGVGPGNSSERIKKLPTALKSAFTRKYNTSIHPVPFIRSDSSVPVSIGGGGSSKDAPDLEDVIEEEPEQVEEEPEEADEDISKDKMIKQGKAPKKASAAAGKGKAKAKAKAKPKAKAK